MHGNTNVKFGNTYWRDNETGWPKFDQGSGKQVFGFLQKEAILGRRIWHSFVKELYFDF
jgi:hypothetical protein